MQEWVDILDNRGNPIGKTCTKKEAHKRGLFHLTIHIWFYTTNGELLIQLRNKNKINYPNYWDVSVAGHVNSQETILDAAIRETSEELGLVIKPSHLQKIFTYKSEVTHQPTYIDNEFNHVFITALETNINKLKIQKSEVSEIRLISITDFKKELNNNSIKFVPYSNKYFRKLFTELKKK